MERVLQADLDLLKDAAVRAGAIAMSFFRRNPNSWSKLGGSPVTEADIAVDNMLREELLRARPEYGWLSEETADDPARLERDAVFVVDPIDGTRGFMAGDERWCVSAAVVREGRPVTAVLVAPALSETYTAISGRGAWLGSRRLAVSGWPGLRNAKLAGPRGWLKAGLFSAQKLRIEPHVPSLAYRIASVASGSLDAAFASPNSHDWDLAACDLLVHEAGGLLTGLDGRAPIYNGESVLHGVLAASNQAMQPDLLAALRKVARERTEAGLPA